MRVNPMSVLQISSGEFTLTENFQDFHVSGRRIFDIQGGLGWYQSNKYLKTGHLKLAENVGKEE
jgi:hypothetical protein